MLKPSMCPCQSGNFYQNCCAPLHQKIINAKTAEQLMRSRYTAFVFQDIDYIVSTTVPNQQNLLDKNGLIQWAEHTQWCGLEIISHQPYLTKRHSVVEFKAQFMTGQGICIHHERSLFVNIKQHWYFVDPTVTLPTMKEACICDSGRKFKYCCGVMLCQFYGKD